MPQYGEFHNGRIINIRLKPDHTSSEIGAKFNGAFAGGGAERTARLAGATNRDRLRVIYSFDFRENEGLSATDRAFSREQDHRDTGGRDLRLAWGHAAVVTAVEGTLHGLMNAQGEPVRTALAPLNQDGRTLTPGDFLPPDPTVGDVPYGQRRFNSAAYRELVSPSQSKTVNLGFTFALSEQFNLEVNASHNDSRGQNLGPPPISPSSSQTVVPAAYNPFNQDVSVGMIHETFGPTFRRQQSARDQIGLNLEGDLWDDWDLELSMGYRYNDSARRGDELDPAKLATALTAEDPAQRFNPFADTRYFDPNAHLYSALISSRISENTSERWEAEVELEGPVFTLPGGEAELEIEAGYADNRQESLFTRRLGSEPERRIYAQRGQEWGTSLRMPFVGSDNAVPGVRRLELHTAGEYNVSSDDASEVEWESGLVWAPFRSLMFRARVRSNTQAPPIDAIGGSDTLGDETLVDPRRGEETVNGVRVFTRQTVLARDEEEDRLSLGAVYEPPVFPGLELRVSYQERRETGLYEDNFDAQDIINNEAAFAARVDRAEPSAADSAAGRPGSLVAIDLTPGSTGDAERKEVEFEISYRPKEMASGRWRISAEVERTLSTRYEVLPGVPYIAEGSGSYRLPRWRGDLRVMWSRGQWNAMVRAQHRDALPANLGVFNGIGALTTLDFNVGRRWKLSQTDRVNGELKSVVGVENVFDRPPARADTVSGYRGGSPLGRTYSAALTWEF